MWFYLRYTNDGYDIVVLGKNGEPKPGMEVNVDLTHEYLARSNINKTLETNKNGVVHLGQLNDISQINATLKSSMGLAELKENWTIS